MASFESINNPNESLTIDITQLLLNRLLEEALYNLLKKAYGHHQVRFLKSGGLLSKRTNSIVNPSKNEPFSIQQKLFWTVVAAGISHPFRDPHQIAFF